METPESTKSFLSSILSKVKYQSVWTCFGVPGRHPADFHLTHKFLGSVDTDRLMQIFEEKIDEHLVVQATPELAFNKVDFFGPNYQRVLVLSNFAQKEFLQLKLRAALDNYRRDDFPEWKPHITIDGVDATICSFTHYYLMVGDKIYREWDLLS